MEIVHQQVYRKKEKMARLANLQRKIDEATEEVPMFARPRMLAVVVANNVDKTVLLKCH